jgi:hypothetical protein
MASDHNHSKASSKDRQLWLLALVTIAIVVSSVTSVDRYAREDLDSLFRRALVTFALARTLNGLISVVQGTEVALQPAGIGVTLTPGEILDPVNDLVERFSWIMLAATISLGIQQVLLDIGQWWVLRVLVGLSGLLWLWWVLKRSPPGQNQQPAQQARTRTILMRVFLVLLFLRFAVPVSLVANESLYILFLQARFDESAQLIEGASRDLQEKSAEPQVNGNTGAKEETGFLESFNKALSSTAETVNFSRRLEHLKERAAELIEHLIQLSVVFILQTGVLPLAFLWMLINLLKRLLSPRA